MSEEANAESREDNVDPKEDRLISIGGMVQSGSLSMGVILWVHGCMIAGTMVDHKTYTKALAQAFSKSSNEFVQAIATHMTDATNDSPEEEKKPSSITREFIYLIDISVYMGNQWVRHNDSCWKGRISSVDGFAYGTPS